MAAYVLGPVRVDRNSNARSSMFKVSNYGARGLLALVEERASEDIVCEFHVWTLHLFMEAEVGEVVCAGKRPRCSRTAQGVTFCAVGTCWSSRFHKTYRRSATATIRTALRAAPDLRECIDGRPVREPGRGRRNPARSAIQFLETGRGSPSNRIAAEDAPDNAKADSATRLMCVRRNAVTAVFEYTE